MFTRPKGRGKTTPLQTDESHRSWRGRVGQRACESSIETSGNDALDAQRGASCADCARAAQWALFTWHPAHARAALCGGFTAGPEACGGCVVCDCNTAGRVAASMRRDTRVGMPARASYCGLQRL